MPRRSLPDVVAEPSAENLARLSSALATIDARYVDVAARTIRPTPKRLMQNRMSLLETRLGRLDVAREIGDGWGWTEARQRCREAILGAHAFRVLDLAAVIETKRQAGTPKDLAVLPILEETLRLSRFEQGEATR